MITKIEGQCQYEGCDKPAEAIAEGRSWFDEPRHHLGLYCEPHASIVEYEAYPEYIVNCPNCGCRFGVN